MDAIFRLYIHYFRGTTIFMKGRWCSSLRSVPFYRSLSTVNPIAERIVTAGEKKAFKKRLDKFYNMMQVPGESQLNVQLIDENGRFLGVRSKSYARKMAFDKEMVLIDLECKDFESIFGHKAEWDRQFSGDTPICAVMNSKSDEYRELQKITKESRKAEKASEIRKHTLRLPIDISTAHLEAKLKQIDSWLSKGGMIEIFMRMNEFKDSLKTRNIEEKIAAVVGTRATLKTSMKSDQTLYIEIIPIK